MPHIKPEGLLHGERIRSLSLKGKFYWPYIYAASNGYGRIKLEYFSLISAAFDAFQEKPTVEDIEQVIQEFSDKYLLFLYEAADGHVWGAWDCHSGQRYFTAVDKRSPAPPELAFTQWKEKYRELKKATREPNTVSLGGRILNGKDQQQQPLVDFTETLRQTSQNISEGLPQNALNTKNTTQEHNTQNTTPAKTVQTPPDKPTDDLFEPMTISGAEYQGRSQPTRPFPAPSPPEPCILPQDPAERVASYRLFREVADSVGMIASPDEWEYIETTLWVLLDPDLQCAATKGILDRKNEEYRNPKFVPGAVRYLEKRLWTRPLRPLDSGLFMVNRKSAAREARLDQEVDRLLLKRYGGQDLQ